MTSETHNGDSPCTGAGVPDSLVAAIDELRRRPRSQWLDLVRADQSERWRRRAGAPSELYLSLLPEFLADEEETLVLICGEIHLRRELGEQPAIEEYERRFPRLSSAIALQFEVDRVFDATQEPAAVNDDGARDVELPGYELLKRIGSGTSGTVYRALQKSLKRIVAIKVCSVRGAEAKTLARLDQEAEIVARLNHPQVVQVYEVVRTSDELYMVMEFVDGPNLQEYAAGRPLTPCEAAGRAHLLARAIEKVHGAGILHRDLKPSNILVPGDDQLKITDFGLAKLRSSHTLLTTEDSVLGTPSYMAPEQATGAAHGAGPEADVYSLGAILYEMITGRPPFLGATVLDTLSLVRQFEPAPPRQLQPTVPRDLETIALKCMAKEPQRRYPTAAALAADLERFMAGVPIHARRPSQIERVLRWSRRNPLASTLATALILAITGGFAGVLWQLRVAQAARHAESEARQEANRRMVQLKDAVALVERAKHFRDSRRFDDARKCLDEAVRLRPEYRTGWEDRGNLHGSLGLWQLALDDRRLAMTLAAPPAAIHWWDYAVLLAYADDRKSLAEWSERMREQFRGHVGANRRDMVRASCLINVPGTDYGQLVKLAQLELPDVTKDSHGAYILGLAYYRAERFEEAVALCQKSISPEWKQTNPWCYGLNYPVLALAHGRQGRNTLAGEMLRYAKDWEDHWTQQLYDSGSPRWRFGKGAPAAWPLSPADWLEFQILMREVRLVRNEAPPLPDPRWMAIRARSFVALGRHDDAVREYQSALTLSPDDAQIKLELHRSVALAAARRADYARAATEFGNAWHLDPEDTLLCQYHAQAHLYAGNLDAYRQACREMFRQFKDTQNPESAARLVHTCTQQADSLPNITDLLPLSEVAANAWPGGEWLQAVTCVRAGKYADALRYFQQAESRQVPRPRDLCFKAIAYHHLGQREQSERCLEEARNWIRRADREHLPVIDMAIPFWGPWYERSESLALLAEAESQFSMGSPAP